MTFLTEKIREMIEAADHSTIKFGYMPHGSDTDKGTPWTMSNQDGCNYYSTPKRRTEFFALLRENTPKPRLELGEMVYFNTGSKKYRVLLEEKQDNAWIWGFEILDEIPEKHKLPTKATDTAFTWIPGELRR